MYITYKHTIGVDRNLLFNFSENNLLSFFFIFGFLVKLPIYPLHLWLLKTHLEAPVEASILLAGILLKLGSYGLLRFSILWSKNILIKNIVLPLRFRGSLIICLYCLFCQDYKLLVANSSIVHINLSFFCCSHISFFALTRRLIRITRHGVCSSGLFRISNLIYKYFGTRRFFIAKNIISLSPYICIWLFFLLISNIGVPPTINLIVEIKRFILVFSLTFFLRPLFFIFIFICGSYCVYYYYICINGRTRTYSKLYTIDLLHNIMYILHLSPLIIFLLWVRLIF